MAGPEVIRLLTENLSARDGAPPFELLARKADEVPQILKPIATAAGYMTLLLKTTHVHALTIYTGHRNSKMGLTGTPPYWTGFTVPVRRDHAGCWW